MSKDKVSIDELAWKMIGKLDVIKDEGRRKTILANIRSTVGKSLDDANTIWPFLFEYLPEEYLGRRGEISPYENAIYMTLQVYAIIQQGSGNRGIAKELDGNFSMGDTLRILRRGDESDKSLNQRFNAMVTANEFEEFCYHLRHLVRILKAKVEGSLQVDYGKLARDLYWLQREKKKEVSMNWSRCYYKSINSKTNDVEEEK